MCVWVGEKHNNLDRFQISCEQHIFIMFLRNILVHVARVHSKSHSFNSAEKNGKENGTETRLCAKKSIGPNGEKSI